MVILQKIYLELHGLVYSVCLTEEILTFLTTSGAKWFFHEVIFQPCYLTSTTPVLSTCSISRHVLFSGFNQATLRVVCIHSDTAT